MAQNEVGFTRLDESTAEDYALVTAYLAQQDDEIADTVLQTFGQLVGPAQPFKVNMYDHCLQTATRAHRDGADEETVVVALLHDMGHFLAPANHGAVVAEILKPFISDDNAWLLRNHTVFQGYYYFHHIGVDPNTRDKFRGHPAFDKTVEFCERWDQTAFDPDYDSMPLDAFEPMVRRTFTARRSSS